MKATTARRVISRSVFRKRLASCGVEADMKLCRVNMDLTLMALPSGAQGFTAMADALATGWGTWVGWSWRTALVSNVRQG
ncbi:MAG TPA: hypothetical protein DDY91_01735 [Planctomycetaceae bacterium]|nr:hypothetical protein [Planctomycetaceae bacterium]